MVTYGVGDESDSDPKLATKSRTACCVDRSEYTMSGCMPRCHLCVVLFANRPSVLIYSKTRKRSPKVQHIES